MNSKSYERMFKTPFSDIYPFYVEKAERKGRTKEEVDRIICWLTGHDKESLIKVLDSKVTVREFLESVPQVHQNATKITGVICGIRVETIEDPLIQKIRWLDKLIDELAKGKPMEKILRS